MLTMGCKFSIQVDQPRPKTPLWGNKKTPRERTGSTDSTQTGEAEDSPEPSPDAEDSEEEGKGYDSSPEQVNVKTVSSTNRGVQKKWKP